MARWTVVMMLCWSLGIAAARADEAIPAQINLVSEQWVDYTNADGTGIGWDLMRKIFEPAGVVVRQRIVPYTRSVGLVQKGEADAWVGSYKDEEQAVYPRWNYDTDHIYALGLATTTAPTLANVGTYQLAWVRGYEYQRYLPNVQHFNEIRRRNAILSMLDHGRADFYIDALIEINFIVKGAPDPSLYRLTPLVDLPLYLGFADTPRGRALRDLFDRRMDELAPSGELKPIFAHWKQPYPFDAVSKAVGR